MYTEYCNVAPAPVLNSNLPVDKVWNVIACLATNAMLRYSGNRYVITGPSFILLVIFINDDNIVQQSRLIFAKDLP